MIVAPLHDRESERLAALRRLAILDTQAEAAFDELTALAVEITGAPIALVSLVDADRQWFKSRQGLGATETPRAFAFCAHAILAPQEVLLVPDALQDPRFFDNPLVLGAPHVRFYVGVPICDPQSQLPMGTVCSIASEPMQLNASQVNAMRLLARQVERQLGQRRAEAERLRVVERLALEAGRSEVVTNILHDIGNAATAVSSQVGLMMGDADWEERRQLQRLAELLRAQSAPLAAALGPERAAGLLAFVDALHGALIGRETELQTRFTSVSQAVRHVQDIITIQRQYAVRVEAAQFSTVVIAELIEHACAIQGGMLERRKVQLTQEIYDRGAKVSGDKTQLIQVLVNLIKNACESFDAGGTTDPTLLIRLATQGETLQLNIKDNGPGFPEGFVLDRSRFTSKATGSGLGLYNALSVMASHGGQLKAHSNAPEPGVTFTVTLPRLGLDSHLVSAAGRSA